MDLLDDELKGSAREDLSKALLSAFSTSLALEKFVMSAFGWEWEQITTGTLEERVWMLIEKVAAEGLTRRLIRRAAWENPGNPKLQAFLKDHKFLRPLPTPVLKKLHETLRTSGLAVSILEEVAGSVEGLVLPEDWWNLTEAQQSIELLMALVSLAPVGNALPPLLDVVARLGHRPESAAFQDALHDWLLLAGRALKLPSAQLESRWSRARAEVPGKPLFLLVKIDLQDPGEYMVKAWLSDERARECEVVFGGDGKLYPLSGLDEQVQLILSEVRKHHRKRLIEARDELTFEFFLPRTLICRRLDTIPIEGGAQARVPLGIKYGVVVRSAERIAATPEPNARFSWEVRWRVFRDDPSSLRPLFIRTAEESKRKDLIARMAGQRDFFLGLMLVPLPEPRPSEEDLLTTLVLRTGMPIALWLHAGAVVDEAVAKEIEQLLEEIQSLPSQLRLQRLAGFQDEHHLGNRLSLLWDDPERLPQEFQEALDLEPPSAGMNE